MVVFFPLWPRRPREVAICALCHEKLQRRGRRTIRRRRYGVFTRQGGWRASGEGTGGNISGAIRQGASHSRLVLAAPIDPKKTTVERQSVRRQAVVVTTGASPRGGRCGDGPRRKRPLAFTFVLGIWEAAQRFVRKQEGTWQAATMVILRGGGGTFVGRSCAFLF